MYYFYLDKDDKYPAKALMDNGIITLCTLWSQTMQNLGGEYEFVGQAERPCIVEIDKRKNYGPQTALDCSIY
jgi:hypothetical protein